MIQVNCLISIFTNLMLPVCCYHSTRDCLLVSVSVMQVGVLSKSSDRLSMGLSLTYPTLCYKEILLSSKRRVLPTSTLSHTLDWENLAMACRLLQHVNLTGQRWMLIVINWAIIGWTQLESTCDGRQFVCYTERPLLSRAQCAWGSTSCVSICSSWYLYCFVVFSLCASTCTFWD